MKLASVYEVLASGRTYIPLDGVSVIMGASGTGKSEMLRGVRTLMDQLNGVKESGTERGELLAPGERPSTSVAYLEPTETELHVAFGLVRDRRPDGLGEDGAATSRDSVGDPSGESIGSPMEQSPDGSLKLGNVVDSITDQPSGLDANPSNGRWLIGVRLKEEFAHSELPRSSAFLLKREWFLAFERSAAERPYAIAPLEHFDSMVDGTELQLPSVAYLPTDLRTLATEIRGVVGKILESLDTYITNESEGEVPFPETMLEHWCRINGEGSAMMINPLIWHVLYLIQVAANEALPPCVRSENEIWLSVNRLEEWDPMPKLEIDFVQTGGESVAADHISDGFQLWIQFALTEALSISKEIIAILLSSPEPGEEEWDSDLTDAVELLALTWQTTVGYDVEETKTLVSSTLDHLRAKRATGGGPSTSQPNPLLYIIDKPERHLDPGKARQSASWLKSFLDMGSAHALIASQSPAYLDFDSAAYLNSWEHRGTFGTSKFDPESLSAFDQVSQDIGLNRGELLSSVNTLLFVGGRTDQVLLEKLYSRELRDLGVAIVPVHGVFKLSGVIEAEVLARITNARLALLVDNTVGKEVEAFRFDADRRRDAMRSSRPEIAQVAHLLETALHADRDVEVQSLPAFDMFGMLDEALLKNRFPFYPGHRESEQAWEAAQSRETTPNVGRKKFLENAYRIDFSEASFDAVASGMLELGIRPQALTGIIAGLASPDELLVWSE